MVHVSTGFSVYSECYCNQSLGTLSTAAFVPSLIVSIIEFLLIFVWLEYQCPQVHKRTVIILMMQD